MPIVNNDEKERYVRKSSITTFLEKCQSQSFSELLGQEREWIAAVVAATVLVALVATMGAKEKNVVGGGNSCLMRWVLLFFSFLLTSLDFSNKHYKITSLIIT